MWLSDLVSGLMVFQIELQMSFSHDQWNRVNNAMYYFLPLHSELDTLDSGWC